MKIIALYFSGTGNTAYVVQSIRSKLAAAGVGMHTASIERFGAGEAERLAAADTVLFAYPVYGSMAPRIMREFVQRHGDRFRGKDAVIIATQVLFSGDGSAFLARLLRPFEMRILAMEHILMPNNLSDVRWFRVYNGYENDGKLRRAERRIDRFCRALLEGRRIRRGSGVPSRLLGLLQRAGFRKAENTLARALKIDRTRCTLCERCIHACPMNNLFRGPAGLHHQGNCTLCYRCINLCPAKALSLISRKPPGIPYRGPSLIAR